MQGPAAAAEGALVRTDKGAGGVDPPAHPRYSHRFGEALAAHGETPTTHRQEACHAYGST